MEIKLKNKCLYVIIPIRFFSVTICNLLTPSYIKLFVIQFDVCLSAVKEVNIIMHISKIRYKT